MYSCIMYSIMYVSCVFIYLYLYIIYYIYNIFYIYIYIYIYIYQINLRTAAVSLFESSSAQLRSNEDFEGPDIYIEQLNKE